MSEQLFECGKCGELTPLVKKNELFLEDLKHEYAECQNCHKKTTIMVSDKKLRGMLLRQKNTKPGKQKVKLAEEIMVRMNYLNSLVEE